MAIAKPRKAQDERQRLQSVYGRNLETQEVLERFWRSPQPYIIRIQPADAWGREEQYISGPYRVTEIHVKILERIS